MTPTELCNVALGHIGQARIADIGERSPGAEHCRRMFDHVRRLCLRDHDWNFAVRRAALTALDSPPPFGFSAAYQLPADCLRVLAINGQPAGVRGTQWEVEGRTVLINADAAHLRYIADADDVTQWDSIFASYFGYRLAAAVAPSFRIDPQAGLQLEQMAAAVRSSAQEADNVETAPRVTRLDQSEIIQERGGRWPSCTAGTSTGNAGGSTIGWGTIAVAGQSSVNATVAGDVLTFEAGTNITLVTNPTTKKVIIAATGGGSGTVNLTPSRTANAVTITPSGGGTAAEIPQANNTNAGVLTAAHHQTIQNLGTISTQSAANVAITGGAITGTTVSGITLTNGGSGALTVTGAALVSGTNTGNQTIILTGDVTGSGTGSFVATIASNAVTTAKLDAEAVTYAKIQSLAAASTLLGRGTSGGAVVREIGIGAGLTMSGDTLSAAGTGDVTGPASSTANAIARFSGTGGKTLLNSAIVIDDIDATTQQNVAIRNVDPAANSALVLTPKGTGAFILGPKPDGATTGGVARGARAVDLSLSRTLPARVASGEDSFNSGVSNLASGIISACLGGNSNQATASRAAVVGGFANIAGGVDSVVIGGQSNGFGNGASSAILAGNNNVATASVATTIGGSRAVANRIGMTALANGRFSADGDAQRGTVVMRRQTTDATPASLSLDGAAPSGSSITTSTHFILLNNQAVFADIRVVARSTSGTDHAAYMRRVLIKRDANAASTAIIGSVLSPTADIESAGATAWDVGVTADTTNGGMIITVTGAASTTINWTAEVSFVETIRA
jgi:hypothetical protein